MLSKRYPYIMILILGLGFLAGCSQTVRKDSEIGWPPPPQKPIIVYKDSYYGSWNLPRSFTQRVKDFLFGRKEGLDINKPYGVSLDGDKKLYIVDTAKKGILIFGLKSGKIKFINSLGSYGKLQEPVNLVLDKENNFYIADTKLGRVIVFDREYNFSHFIGGDSVLKTPVGITIIESLKRIYVVDSQQHKVFVFDLSGNYLFDFGKKGDNPGEFFYPLGITANSGDTLFVVDSFHFAVQAFDADGNYLYSFGPNASGIGPLARPRDIAIDSDGHLYVTDALKHNVQIFDKSGHLLLTFGSVGLNPGQFRLPAGIYITDDDQIWVADSINRRIQHFSYLEDNQR